MACFWTDLFGVRENCVDAPGPGANANAIMFSASLAGIIWDGDVLFAPAAPPYPDPDVVDLMALPGTTYGVATENACAGAVSINKVGNVLSTSSAQASGSCQFANWFYPLSTITDPEFPEADYTFAYSLVYEWDGYALATTPSANKAVQMVFFNPTTTGTYFSLGKASLTPSSLTSNTGIGETNGFQTWEEFRAQVATDGIQLRISGDKSNTSADCQYEFSADLRLLIPPPVFTQHRIEVLERWDVSLNDELEYFAFPAEAGEEVSYDVAIRHNCSWPNITATTFVTNTSEYNSMPSGLYRARIMSGDNGYTNMEEVAVLKIVKS